MLEWLKALIAEPKPSGLTRTIRCFDTNHPILADGVVRVGYDSWILECDSKGRRNTAPLFEATNPGLEHHKITLTGRIRTDAMAGWARLQLWGILPSGEMVPVGLSGPLIIGTTSWGEQEIEAYTRTGFCPVRFLVCLQFYGAGRVWLRDMELAATPYERDESWSSIFQRWIQAATGA